MTEKAEKQPFFARIGKFFRDQQSEVKKIVWPSKKQVLNNTMIVLVAVIVFAIGVGAFDWVVGILIKALIGA